MRIAISSSALRTGHAASLSGGSDTPALEPTSGVCSAGPESRAIDEGAAPCRQADEATVIRDVVNGRAKGTVAVTCGDQIG
ncbi:hypothetical protein ACFY41_03305 [Streptomyces syringium]|uniref:hypothetical protein n=1 Tax=Streptomyces syringium TaxID=76729 RepID=UPI0036837453